MGSHAQPYSAAGLVLMLALATPGSATAQDNDPALAETLFQEAIRLFEDGKYAEACPKFAASHKSDPGYGAVSNLGLCYKKIGKTASAWAAFLEAVAIAKNPNDAAEAKHEADTLEPRLLRLRIVVAGLTSGLTVTKDGSSIGRAAWGVAAPVDPGTYRVDASAPGKKPWSTTVAVDGVGLTTQVEIPTLPDDARPVVLTVPSATGSAIPVNLGQSFGTRRILALSAGGLGIASLAIGGALGLAAKSKWDGAQPHCDAEHYCDSIGLAEGNVAREMAQGATWAFVIGGLSLATGVTLWLTEPARRAPANKPTPGSSAMPWFTSDGGGLNWHGRF